MTIFKKIHISNQHTKLTLRELPIDKVRLPYENHRPVGGSMELDDLAQTPALLFTTCVAGKVI